MVHKVPEVIMEQQAEVFWIARYDYEPDWRVLPHTHDFFQIFYMIDGKGTATLAQREIDLFEGRVLLVPPGTPHGIGATKGGTLKTLDAKFSVHCQALRRELRAARTPIEDDGNQIRSILERIRLEGMRAAPWYRELCNSLLVQACVLFLRLNAGEGGRPSQSIPCTGMHEAVAQVRSYIEENYALPLTLREIAEHIGYTPEYLSHLFSSTTGVSVHHYLMHVRIEQAKEKLKRTGRPIKEICFDCGFKSIHHFSRAFKGAEGIPPAAWREREQEGVWKSVVITPGFVNRDITITT